MSGAATAETARQPVLEMRHISKTFGAIRALQDVSLTAHAGALHARRSRRLCTAFAALGMLPILILLAAGFQFLNPRKKPTEAAVLLDPKLITAEKLKDYKGWTAAR